MTYTLSKSINALLAGGALELAVEQLASTDRTDLFRYTVYGSDTEHSGVLRIADGNPYSALYAVVDILLTQLHKDPKWGPMPWIEHLTPEERDTVATDVAGLAEQLEDLGGVL